MTSAVADVRKKLVDAKHICVFGVGALFSNCYSQIVLTLGRKPDFLCDNSTEKWGKTFFGIPCISPQQLTERSPDALVIIAVRNYEEITAQLQASGVTDVLTFTFGKSHSTVCNIQPISVDDVTEGMVESRMISLEGKWAVITGASRGIGQQISLEMAKQGVNIIAHARARSNCEETITKCKALGVDAFSVEAELEGGDDIKRMLQDIDRQAPQVDILVNCAGIAPHGLDDIWQQKEADYHKAFSINTIAPILLCDHFIPLMIEKGFGRVINVSSNIHHRPAEMAYACSKAALDKYIHDISPALQDSGVLISVVDPGWLRTDMGGRHAPHSVDSVVPGAILGAVLNGYENGQWFVAQDYVGLTLFAAAKKSIFVCRSACAE